MGECTQAELIAALQRRAPLELAGDWDNVGLLVEPSTPRALERVLLTIDLSEDVLEEAVEVGATFIVAYHPPIFAPLQRLTRASEKERVVVRAIEQGIGVYSPHTALDAAEGGVNDWLASAFEPVECVAIEAVAEDTPKVGQGRRLSLSPGLALDAVVARIKEHLGVQHVQLAAAERHRNGESIARIALCAGAGGSVIAGEEVDLWWTGEMRHHDILAAMARGTSVVLCNHTNTERGYLEPLARGLASELPCEFVVSTRDRDPLEFS